VTNGVETDRFSPNFALEEKQPTSVMLSHVYDLKDVKAAIKAAAVIVHQFGLSSYQLLIYGSLDKDIQYVRAVIFPSFDLPLALGTLPSAAPLSPRARLTRTSSCLAWEWPRAFCPAGGCSSTRANPRGCRLHWARPGWRACWSCAPTREAAERCARWYFVLRAHWRSRSYRMPAVPMGAWCRRKTPWPWPWRSWRCLR
jgi:hypothetical protein